jgi:ABC-type amino acid transport substrate-binding protein
MKSLDSLSGKKLSKNRGFTLGDDFNSRMQQQKFTVFEVGTYKGGIKMVLSGRVFAFVSLMDPTNYHIKDMGAEDSVVMLDFVVKKPRGLEIMLSRTNPKVSKALIDKMQAALLNMKEDKSFVKIYEKYGVDYTRLDGGGHTPATQ